MKQVIFFTGLIRVPTPVGKLVNSWEFDLCHTQSAICWEFIVQSGWGIHTKILHLGKMQKLRILLLTNVWEPCYDVALIGVEDRKWWLGIC